MDLLTIVLLVIIVILFSVCLKYTLKLDRIGKYCRELKVEINEYMDTSKTP